MEHKLSTRALTESALMTGLAVIFALLGMMPVIGALTILICGIPITIAAARHGSFAGMLTAILATLLIALFLGPVSALSYGLENMLLGFVIGYMLNKRKSGTKILQASVGTAAIASLVLMIVSMAIMGVTPDTIGAYYAEMEKEMLEMYETSGLTDAMMAQQGVSSIELTVMLQSMVAVLVKLSPAMLMITGGFTGALTCWLTMVILKHLKVRIPRSFGIANWRLPFAAIWPIIIVWTVWLMHDRIPLEWVNILAMNCMVICAALLFVNGITAGMHMLNFKAMSAGMKLLTVVMFIMFFTGFIIAMIILGIADLLFDFRKKKVDNSREVK